MTETVQVALFFAAFAVIFIAVYAFVSRQRRRVLEALRTFATRSGWHDLRTESFLRQGLSGSWNGLPVRVRYMPRQKSIPQRVDVRVGVPAPVRVVVKKRFPGFLSNKPMTLFGPPIVPIPREDVWIRADERSFVDRLLGNHNVAPLLAGLVDRYDEVRLGARGIRVVRAVDGEASRSSAFHVRLFDADAVHRELNKAWSLAKGLTAARH